VSITAVMSKMTASYGGSRTAPGSAPVIMLSTALIVVLCSVASCN
jgi:hypothetical protein